MKISNYNVIYNQDGHTNEELIWFPTDKYFAKSKRPDAFLNDGHVKCMKDVCVCVCVCVCVSVCVCVGRGYTINRKLLRVPFLYLHSILTKFL